MTSDFSRLIATISPPDERAIGDFDEQRPPSYSDPGRILFSWFPTPLEGRDHRAEVEVLDYDHDSCLCWMQEGVGIEYWLRDKMDLELEGTFVIDEVTGHYYRGTWGYDDDDEEWYCGNVRRATDEEIATGCLSAREEKE